LRLAKTSGRYSAFKRLSLSGFFNKIIKELIYHSRRTHALKRKKGICASVQHFFYLHLLEVIKQLCFSILFLLLAKNRCASALKNGEEKPRVHPKLSHLIQLILIQAF
jgi:hypothetical protein